MASDPSHPRTIGEIYAHHQPEGSSASAWMKYALRWSAWPMVAVKVLNPVLLEFTPHWRALLDSLSPGEAQYVQERNPQMVLMVGVDWVGYPEGMFADSPAPDPHTASVGLCERYGLVVGDLGVVPDVAISFVSQPPPPQPRRPVSAFVLVAPAPRPFATPSSTSAAASAFQTRGPSSTSSRASGRGITTNTGSSRAAARAASSSDSDDQSPQDESDVANDDTNDSDSGTDTLHSCAPRRRYRATAALPIPHTPATQPNESRQIATPTALLTYRKLDSRVGRYIHGHLRVRGGRTALANELMPTRAWTAAHVQANLAAINASPASQSLARRVLAFAFARGPCVPISMADLGAEHVAVVGRGKSSVRTQLRTAVNAALVGHVYVLERLEAHGDVWERLVAAAVAGGAASEVATRAALCVFAGVEMVGFETPRASDVLPEWAERRFVVRERYALVV